MSAKDVLARGARSASYGNAGVGESPLLRKLAEQSDEPADLQVEVPTPAIDLPKRPRKKFTPKEDTILVRQSAVEDDRKRYTDQAAALKDTSKDVVIVEKEEDKKQDAPAEGFVLEVGPDHGTINVGDNIVFGKYSGAAFKLNGEWLLLMRVSEVLGTLTDEIVEEEVEETFEAPADGPIVEFVDGQKVNLGRIVAEA